METKNNIQLESVFSFKSTNLIDRTSEEALIIPDDKTIELPFINRKGKFVLSEEGNYVFVPSRSRKRISVRLLSEDGFWACISQTGKLYLNVVLDLNAQNYDQKICEAEDHFEDLTSFLDENKGFVLDTINHQMNKYNERKSRD